MLQTLTKQLKKKSKDPIVEEIEESEEWDEDHALDLVMNEMIEDLEEDLTVTEEELQQIIDDSGIKETIANIGQDFKEAVSDIKEMKVDDVAEGIVELGKEDEKPLIEFNGKIKKAKPQGLIDQTTEQRNVKGPLWQYRTNKNDGLTD